MKQPHDNSAKYYDFVFERRFGAPYGTLTQSNLSKIRDITPKGKILDFGAGTGRISIPLASAGYEVTAVDCSSEMLVELKRKAQAQQLNIDTHLNLTTVVSKDFDLAIAIFTVLAYITDKIVLEKVFSQIYDSLKLGGLFMFDLEKRAGYDQICRNNDGIVPPQVPYERVTVNFQDNDNTLCDYYEESSGTLPNDEFFNYTESFVIKFWTVDEVPSISKQIGFTEIDKFVFANADYFILKKNF